MIRAARESRIVIYVSYERCGDSTEEDLEAGGRGVVCVVVYYPFGRIEVYGDAMLRGELRCPSGNSTTTSCDAWQVLSSLETVTTMIHPWRPDT